jgi:hypothetical protein
LDVVKADCEPLTDIFGLRGGYERTADYRYNSSGSMASWFHSTSGTRLVHKYCPYYSRDLSDHLVAKEGI